MTARIAALTDDLRNGADRAWRVDALDITFGREALSEALAAAARADHHHRLALDERDRNIRLRRALADGIDAARRINAEINLSPVAASARSFAKQASQALERLPGTINVRRGSPGRVVQAAAAEAVAQVWARARARRIPRSGRVSRDHELATLLRAISADVFGTPGKLSVSLLRTPKK